jgi:hypothetical protein
MTLLGKFFQQRTILSHLGLKIVIPGQNSHTETKISNMGAKTERPDKILQHKGNTPTLKGQQTWPLQDQRLTWLVLGLQMEAIFLYIHRII